MNEPGELVHSSVGCVVVALLCADERLQIVTQFGIRPCGGVRPGADEIRPRRHRHLRQQRPELSSHTVALYGRTEGATDRKRHAGRRQRRIEDSGAPQHSGPRPPALSRQTLKGAAVADAPDQADRRCRPLARRAFSTPWPARVRIRWRKPCFLARRRLLGWNVRFTPSSSQGTGCRYRQIRVALGCGTNPPPSRQPP